MSKVNSRSGVQPDVPVEGWRYVELNTDAERAVSVDVAACILMRLGDDVDCDGLMGRAFRTQTAITVPGDGDGHCEGLVIPPDAPDGWWCPKCRNVEHRLCIHDVRVTVEIDADGQSAEADGDLEWEDDNPAQCGCGWFGKVRDCVL